MQSKGLERDAVCVLYREQNSLEITLSENRAFTLVEIRQNIHTCTVVGIQTKSSFISAGSNWTNRIVSIQITTDRTQTLLAGDVSSVDSHTITTGSLKMATSFLSAALYVLNTCPIHSRYVRRGINKRQSFEVGQFLNQVCVCNWKIGRASCRERV